VEGLRPALGEALEQQAATAEILRVIASSPADLQPVLDAVVRSAARLCETSDAAIFRDEGDTLRIVAHDGVIPPVAPVGSLVPRRRGSVTGRVVLEGLAVHVPDLQAAADEFPEGSENARRLGWRATLAVPLMRERTVIGTIGVRRTEARPFSDAQIALLQTFADQAVIAIENVRLFRELQEKNRELTIALDQQTATAEILKVIGRSQTDVQPVFDAIADSALRLCDAKHGNVFLFDGELVHLAAVAGTDWEGTEAVRRSFPQALGRTSATTRAIQTRRPVIIQDVLEDPEYRLTGMVRATTFRSVMSIPMLRTGEPIGAITVTRAEAGPFSDKQLGLLQTFADQAVIAIENVRLFNDLEVRNRDLSEALDRQTATAEVLRVIGRSQTDIRPVFAAIMDCAVRLCAADLGSIFAVEGGQLVPIELWPSTPEAWAVLREVYPRPADRTSLTGRAVAEARVVHVPDIEDPDAPTVLRSVPRRLHFRSQLSVPILRGGQPIGVLSLTRRIPGPFSRPQIELVQTFADQAVIAIENARLLGELQARTDELTQSVGQLTALGEISRAVSSTLDVETVLQTIVSRATQLAGADGCAIYEYDDATEAFHIRATHNLDPVLVETLRTAPLRKGEGAMGRAAETREPTQVADIAAPGAYESHIRDTLLGAGYRALLSVPLLREGEIIGSLSLNRHTPGEFPPEAVEVLKTFATQSALAIQNARLFREIADKSRQLEAASRHKSEFLANMSHELRTPLNGVLGYAQLLQRDRSMTESQREALDAIATCGSQLLDLINDVLDLSKIEAGRLEIEAEPTEVARLISDVRYVVAEAADRKRLVLATDVQQDVPRWVVLDGRYLRQVLLNLLGNAIKFTSAGEVRLSVEQADPGRLAFAVTDTGPGIEPEALTEIFAAFVQTRTGAAAGGTGLGLTISDHLIRRMGGELRVESVVGQGSRFWFTLPLVVARDGAPAGADHDAAVPALDARLAPGQQLTALVVDDSTANRAILAGLLESAGLAVLTASGGFEGISVAQAHRPDVVFMDLKMNDLDGLEATRRLARDPATSGIPIIAVTASALGDVRQTARAAGCVDYLSKPIRVPLLFGMLQTHVGARFVSGSDRGPRAAPGVAEPRRSDVAAGLREALAVGDITAIQALARRLLAGDAADAAMGERISRLAANFDFDGLERLAQGLGA
jgi:signal transduction histidine kinase/DNA-binding NarL/FixJ family response regulator